MDISKIVVIGIIGAVLSITLKKTSPEAAFFVGIATGLVIFFGILGRLTAVIDVLKSLSDEAALSESYISVILKVIGIAYIADFGIQLCKDCGESAIASKIELAGKVIIMAISAPVIVGVMDMVLTIFP